MTVSPPGARPPFPAAAARRLGELGVPAPAASAPGAGLGLPADVVALLRHAFAISDDTGSETRAATLTERTPRQVAFRNLKRVALGLFVVTASAKVYYGFADIVRSTATADSTRMPGIPVSDNAEGTWLPWWYVGPVWIVAPTGGSFPIDVRVVEYSACDPRVLM